MRSRYSAFALGNASYLLMTWHPSTRPASLELDPDLQWTQLDILGATGGGEDDDRGTIEFVAHYSDAAGRPGQQHERSTFLRADGQWCYLAAADDANRSSSAPTSPNPARGAPRPGRRRRGA